MVVLVDATCEHFHKGVDVDFLYAEDAVFVGEVDGCALILVFEHIFEGLLEVAFLGVFLVLCGGAAAVVDLNDLFALVPLLVLLGLAVLRLEQDFVGEELTIVEDVFEVVLGVAVELCNRLSLPFS